MKLGLIDRYGNRIKGGDELWPRIVRAVSIPAAGFLNRANVHPLSIVALSFTLGFFAGLAFSLDRPVWGALLCLISWYFDFVDGDLARLSGKQDALGAYLDSVNGKLFSFFIFGGATVGYWREAEGVAWVWGFMLMTGIYVFSMLKVRADLLDPEISRTPTGLRHQGGVIEKPAWRFVLGFFLSGNDFMLVFTIVSGFFGRLDIAVRGCTVYSWFYAVFNFYHGVKRVSRKSDRQLLKVLFCYICFHTGLFHLYVRFVRRRGELAMLTYHHIKDGNDVEVGEVSKYCFQKQMEYLRRVFDIRPYGEVIEMLEQGKRGARNILALTFDDGFEDFYTTAYPVLRKEDIPAIVFLVSHAVDHQVPIWTERIAKIIKSSRKPFIAIKYNGTESRYSVATSEEKKEALAEIKHRLKRVSDRERNLAMAQLDKAYEREWGGLAANTNMLNWDQIREMRKSKIEFGSHTMSHPILTQLLPHDAENEITGSKKLIEERLSEPVRDFCYPNGEKEDFNEEIIEMIRNAGYRSACTTILGRNRIGSDPYRLKRVYVKDEPLPFLMARICGVIA